MMRRSPRMRRGIGVLLAGLMLVVLAVPATSAMTPEWTEASWTDTEQTAGTFTAITVPAPEGLDCAYNGGVLGLLGTSISIRWRLPAGYAMDDAEYGYVNQDGVLNVLLGSLLGGKDASQNGDIVTAKITSLLQLNLFGSNKVLGVRLKHHSGWVSGWTLGTAKSGSLGTGGTCSFSSAPSV